MQQFIILIKILDYTVVIFINNKGYAMGVKLRNGSFCNFEDMISNTLIDNKEVWILLKGKYLFNVLDDLESIIQDNKINKSHYSKPK